MHMTLGMLSPASANSATYWRDVGTIDSYFAANMDVRSPVPNLNLYNRNWRIRTAHRHQPPLDFDEALVEKRGPR